MHGNGFDRLSPNGWVACPRRTPVPYPRRQPYPHSRTATQPKNRLMGWTPPPTDGIAMCQIAASFRDKPPIGEEESKP
jgi:hypothetical protein